jgi:outer membrane protein OmpA-like peptidoglycan-associated protein
MGVERLRWLRAWACALAPWVVGLAAEEVLAQGTSSVVPATHDMIEALKPVRQRNLMVRPTAAPASAAPSTVAVPASSAAIAATPQPSAPTTPAMASPTAAAPLAGTAEVPPSLSLAIQFELNSARVRPESGTVLGNLVAAMLSAELRSNRFLIEGHTDARGNASANQALSQRRAEEVRLYLVALGVHPARLRAVGKGSSEPANPLDPLAGDNRRVRVVTQE